MFQQKEANRSIHGIKIAKNSPAISHLMYTDDLLVMCRAYTKEAAVVKDCFERYSEWSGQEINECKSCILFSKNTRNGDRKVNKEVMGCTEMKQDAVYVENSFFFSRNKMKEFMKLKERINKRLEGWSSQTLSKAGKAALIKNVVQAIPIYSMSAFKVPTGVCAAMDSVVRSYWWSGKTNSKNIAAWRSWTEVCKPKELGEFRI